MDLMQICLLQKISWWWWCSRAKLRNGFQLQFREQVQSPSSWERFHLRLWEDGDCRCFWLRNGHKWFRTYIVLSFWAMSRSGIKSTPISIWVVVIRMQSNFKCVYTLNFSPFKNSCFKYAWPKYSTRKKLKCFGTRIPHFVCRSAPCRLFSTPQIWFHSYNTLESID